MALFFLSILQRSSEVAWFTLRACGHGRRFSGLLAQGHRFTISNLHTPHTHRPPHVCTHSHTETLPPPSSFSTKLLLWPPSLLSPIKNRQDKSITSPTRALSSSLLFLSLIIHPCQANQPSRGALGDSAPVLWGQSVASILGTRGDEGGGSNSGPTSAFIITIRILCHTYW